ncbi:MAG: M28 family metallopeptidase [Eubacteriaceae bacterium]|nr:M28 family metallopeptidase [Eubacteriaceae bacterium]
MDKISRKLLEDMAIRKTSSQKKKFREFAVSEFARRGYSACCDKGFWGTNVIIGDLASAHVIFCAHYDTPPASLFPNKAYPLDVRSTIKARIWPFAIALPFQIVPLTLGKGLLAAFFTYIAAFGFVLFLMLAGPANKHNANDNTSGIITLLKGACAIGPQQKSNVAFIFFDNEEKGLLGSFAFKKRYKPVAESKLVFNFDSVGHGDQLYLFYPPAIQAAPKLLLKIRYAALSSGISRLLPSPPALFTSDHINFNYGVGLASLFERDGKAFTGNLHTRGDVHINEGLIDMAAHFIVGLSRAF